MAVKKEAKKERNKHHNNSTEEMPKQLKSEGKEKEGHALMKLKRMNMETKGSVKGSLVQLGIAAKVRWVQFPHVNVQILNPRNKGLIELHPFICIVICQNLRKNNQEAQDHWRTQDSLYIMLEKCNDPLIQASSQR